MALTGYITAFVDLLGLGLQLEKLDIMFADDVDEQVLLRYMQDSLGQVLRLRREFEEGFERLRMRATSPPSGLSSVEALAWQKAHSPTLAAQYVSDAVILSILADARNPRATYIGLHWLLQTIAHATLVLLAKNQTCRGAIEIGTGGELSSGEIVGAALARAHRLERDRATFPRVIIGPALLKLLLPPTGADWRTGRRDEALLASECCSLLARDDEDGEYFVDFLASWSLEAFRNGARPTTQITMKARLAALCAQTHSNEKIAAKYRWLERYARSRQFWVEMED